MQSSLVALRASETRKPRRPMRELAHMIPFKGIGRRGPRMGPRDRGLRGFRVSLAHTAAKDDYIRGRSIITSFYRR